jgi:hypothetical protein
MMDINNKDEALREFCLEIINTCKQKDIDAFRQLLKKNKDEVRNNVDLQNNILHSIALSDRHDFLSEIQTNVNFVITKDQKEKMINIAKTCNSSLILEYIKYNV